MIKEHVTVTKVTELPKLQSYQSYMKRKKMIKNDLERYVIRVLIDHYIQKCSHDILEYERGKKILLGLCSGGEVERVIKILVEWVGI